PDEAYAGQRDQWTVTLGGFALPPGGQVKLLLCGGRGNPCDWGWPQTDRSQDEGYVSARASNGAALSLWVPKCQDTGEVAVVVTVGEPGITENDTVTILLGDKSQGSPGIRPQTFSQRRKPLKVFIRETDAAEWTEASNPPVLDVLGGPADRIRAFVPAAIRPNEEFDALLKVEDEFGNVASFYEGSFSMEAIGAELIGPDEVSIARDEGCLKLLRGLRVTGSTDHFRLHLSQPHQDVELLSNPCWVLSDDEPYRLYWGVLHGHTGQSDGVGTPEEYFERMRDENRLDFGALGDHDHLWETDDETWRRTQEATAKFNEPGRFVTFLGYEWAKWRRNGDGDRCVYFLDDYQPMYRSDDGEYPRPWHLFRALRRRHEGRALVIPHHTAARANFCDFSQHDPIHERLIEIYSVWGSSERSVHDGNPFPLRPPGIPEGGCADGIPLDAGEEPAGFVQRALMLGWRVGFTAGGDDHLCHAGDPVRSGVEPFRYRDGLLGIWAEDLTRHDLWDGLWNRRTIATTGARIIVDWTVNEYPIGADIQARPGDGILRARNISVAVSGETKILRIEIIRNNQVVHAYEPQDEFDVAIDWRDDDHFDDVAIRPRSAMPPFLFYYVRVLQADGEMAWASPIWITLSSEDSD
ncbi:MAG: DUF3604 domain-containing protein, partial [Armatimonadetes bacterium]|nr:DUF3604 domain-containing protein [Armatimonadota bacterium]